MCFENNEEHKIDNEINEEGAMRIKKILIFAIVVLAIAAAGCATHKRSQLDVLTTDAYPCHMTAKGISAAAEPFETEKEAKKGFYVDVRKQGFYPVLVVFRNGTNDRIIFLKDTVELIDAGNNVYRPVGCTVMSDACEHNKMAYALLGFGIFSYMSAEEANRKMATDWREKEIQDQCIIPAGRKKSGFVYFKLPEGKTTEGCTLKLQVESLETNEKVPFEFNL